MKNSAQTHSFGLRALAALGLYQRRKRRIAGILLMWDICSLIVAAGAWQSYLGAQTLNIPMAPLTLEVQAASVKEYAYNEPVPVAVIKREINKTAKRFGVDAALMQRIADCESNWYNLAANPRSSALGVFQFLNGTWEETGSWKVYHRVPTEYKANIFEAGLALSRGEAWRWNATKWCWGK